MSIALFQLITVCQLVKIFQISWLSNCPRSCPMSIQLKYYHESEHLSNDIFINFTGGCCSWKFAYLTLDIFHRDYAVANFVQPAYYTKLETELKALKGGEDIEVFCQCFGEKPISVPERDAYRKIVNYKHPADWSTIEGTTQRFHYEQERAKRLAKGGKWVHLVSFYLV